MKTIGVSGLAVHTTSCIVLRNCFVIYTRSTCLFSVEFVMICQCSDEDSIYSDDYCDLITTHLLSSRQDTRKQTKQSKRICEIYTFVYTVYLTYTSYIFRTPRLSHTAWTCFRSSYEYIQCDQESEMIDTSK